MKPVYKPLYYVFAYWLYTVTLADYSHIPVTPVKLHRTSTK